MRVFTKAFIDISLLLCREEKCYMSMATLKRDLLDRLINYFVPWCDTVVEN
jgi:hypothetical protein